MNNFIIFNEIFHPFLHLLSQNAPRLFCFDVFQVQILIKRTIVSYSALINVDALLAVPNTHLIDRRADRYSPIPRDFCETLQKHTESPETRFFRKFN